MVGDDQIVKFGKVPEAAKGKVAPAPSGTTAGEAVKFKKETISLAGASKDAPTQPVEARTYKGLAIHKALDADGKPIPKGGWKITHIQSGLAIPTYGRSDTLSQAKKFVESISKKMNWDVPADQIPQDARNILLGK